MLFDLVLIGIAVLCVLVLFGGTIKFKVGSLLGNISNAVRKVKDNATEATKDLPRDGKYRIEDAKRELAEFSEKIGGLKKQSILLRNQVSENEVKSSNMDVVAQKAAKAGNEGDVAAALSQKSIIDKKLAVLKSQLAQNEDLETKMIAQQRKFQDKIEAAEGNLQTLVVRDEAAKIRTELAKSAAGFGTSSALGSLDELQDAVEDKEAGAEAAEEMAAVSNKPDALADKYETSDTGNADKVAEYMATYGKK